MESKTWAEEGAWRWKKVGKEDSRCFITSPSSGSAAVRHCLAWLPGAPGHAATLPVTSTAAVLQ